MLAQFQIINKILQTKDFSIVTLNNISDKYFYAYKAEFKYIREHFNKYKTVPDRLTFTGVFPNFDIMDITEPDNYLVEQLINDYNTSYLVSKFNDIKKLLEDDKTKEAVEIAKQLNEGLTLSSTMSCVDILSDTSRYDRYLERATNLGKYYISTGFPELDQILGGIDRENENMVIAARTGIGKTWTLLIMAAEASKQGLRVGIYSGEMSVDKVAYRIDTLLGNISNSAITRGEQYVKDTYKRYIDSLGAMKGNWGPIKVLTPNMINGPATVEALQAFIEREHLDILFVDQYSLLEDTSGSKVMHEKVANISKAIKNLQVMKQIPIISFSQMNRTSTEDKEQNTTQIGLSDRIGQDATVVLMLDRIKAEEKLVINIVKSRDGGDNRKLVYRADFNNGTFTYLNDKPTAEQAQQLANDYAVEDEADDSGAIF